MKITLDEDYLEYSNYISMNNLRYWYLGRKKLKFSSFDIKRELLKNPNGFDVFTKIRVDITNGLKSRRYVDVGLVKGKELIKGYQVGLVQNLVFLLLEKEEPLRISLKL